jgi:hypothetical protein
LVFRFNFVHTSHFTKFNKLAIPTKEIALVFGKREKASFNCEPRGKKRKASLSRATSTHCFPARRQSWLAFAKEEFEKEKRPYAANSPFLHAF